MSYALCCGQYHKNFQAPTAEALMRSRYTAFCLDDFTYLDKTMREAARVGFNLEESQAWAQSVYWLGLTIIEASDPKEEQNSAYVEFIARYMINNSIQAIHEKSEFKRIDEHWYYVSGIKPKNKHSPKTIKISNNQPCPCNSLKKFKNCHGKSAP